VRPKGTDVTAGYGIALAAEGDIEGILDLQDRNQPDRGGTLSARFSRGWFETALAAMPVIAARREGRVVGYLVSSPLSAYADVPVVQAMLAAYSGAAGAYVYGPICVEKVERRRGLAGAMFAELRAQLRGREGVLFIRRDNAASLKAHACMGMREVAGFTHGAAKFVVLSYIG
jgi:L-amino acid N-acyltransferase YncA